MAKQKNKMDSTILIPGFLLIGLGVGFILLEKIPIGIPGFTLLGLGIGMILAYIFREK